MIFIQCPFHRVIGNILPDYRKIGIVTNDMFMIIALPHRIAGIVTQGVDPFGGGGFETREN